MLQVSASHEVIRKFFKFCIIGGLGSAVNLAILYALTTFAGLYYFYSEIFAIISAGSFNFWMNVKWGNISLTNAKKRESQNAS